MLPHRPALAQKWKRGAQQRRKGRGAAAQSLLTAVQTQQARQTAATLPAVALQPLLEVVLPPLETPRQSYKLDELQQIDDLVILPQGWERKSTKERATRY